MAVSYKLFSLMAITIGGTSLFGGQGRFAKWSGGSSGADRAQQQTPGAQCGSGHEARDPGEPSAHNHDAQYQGSESENLTDLRERRNKI